MDLSLSEAFDALKGGSCVIDKSFIIDKEKGTFDQWFKVVNNGIKNVIILFNRHGGVNTPSFTGDNAMNTKYMVVEPAEGVSIPE